jgi:CheY-like chemotaxis protein
LDISKIETGKLTLTEETVDLTALLTTVNNIILPRCEEKKLSFIHNFDKLDCTNFKTDALRLRQVLINILGNAVKFTPETGRVEFNLSKEDRRDGRTLLRFSVRDTGIGITKEAISTIFRSFEQADSRFTTRQYGGAGLGLTISNHIVQLLGGEIVVNSQPGEGSDFNFAIWLKEVEQKASSAKPLTETDNKMVGKRALLVDDVDLNRRVAKAMLKKTGISIDEVDDGIPAVEKFQESELGYYDIIFMDLQMPHMDGFTASRTIRALDRADAKTVPIVALTANAFQEDIDKAKEAGMNSHLAKPVKIDKLTATLFEFVQVQDP